MRKGPLSQLRALSASAVFSLLPLLGTSSLQGAPVSAEPAPGWWKDATFYEIFVRSFADSKTGPLAGDGIGDLQGVIDHLDYLNDGKGAAGQSLGITALWLMPVQPSPSYHGYDVSDYFDVNPQYGDLATMKRLVAEAHRHGIRVIVDFVFNHASSDHPFFKQALADKNSPERALFRFGPKPDDPAGPWGTPCWHQAGDDYYYGIFVREMPDWNFRNPAVTEHHYKAAKFWLEQVGVDGFRLDAVRYLYEAGKDYQDLAETKAWLRDFTAYCHSIKPGSFVVGECWTESKIIASYLTERSCDSFFEFDLSGKTIDAVNNGTAEALTAQLKDLRALDGSAAPWSCFLANHDQVRTRTQLGGDLAKARLAAELQFTEPGVPFVYYGEEIGMLGAKPDPDLRTPMPWTPEKPNAGFTAASAKPWHDFSPNAATLNVQDALARPDSLLVHYRRLIQLNASSPALRHGDALYLTGGDKTVLADMRKVDGEVVLVLANVTDKAAPCPALSLESSPLTASWPLSEELQGAKVTAPKLDAQGGFNAWTPLPTLAPRSVYVVRFLKK